MLDLQFDMFVAKLTTARDAAQAASRAAAAPGSTVEGDAAQDAAGGAAVVPDEANAVWPMLLWKGAADDDVDDDDVAVERCGFALVWLYV